MTGFAMPIGKAKRRLEEEAGAVETELNLRANGVVQRVPDLDIHLGPRSEVVIDLGTRRLHCPQQALAVLAEFSSPQILSQGVATLEQSIRTSEEQKQLRATIVKLYQAGVLRDESWQAPPPRQPPVGYAAAREHIRMLNDRARTERFLEAIDRCVGPDDVVIDLGTGTGILAVAAARAGAKRVYAIEQSDIGDSAAKLFADNGLADRIELVRGRSTEVDLPERGDILVSEMIGSEPLEEQILSVTADAVKRLLKPGARLIPHEVEVYGLPVTIPRKQLEKTVLQEATLRKWQAWYGVDYAPMVEHLRGRRSSFYVNPYKARDWPFLSAGVPLLKVDLRAVGDSAFQQTASATAVVSGCLNGVLIYFQALLGPGLQLSTHPAAVMADNHWCSQVWVLPEDLSFEAGDRFSVTYSRRAPGIPDGARVVRIAS